MSDPLPIERLTVLYDAQCGLCRRARRWIESQPAYVPLEFLAAGSAGARERYPELAASQTLVELHVVAPDGRLWRGAGAWVMCLWALRETRSLALRLSGPRRMALAQSLVAKLSARRYTLSEKLGWNDPQAPTGT